ncbi:MAG TPA: hypothetical protein VM077_02190 [Candidatus Limnocylindrales bacterium]|nr:hypothetical protein [Candidatus Limnocylindrales bacterium]
MSIITASITNKNYYKNPYFDLLVDSNRRSTRIAANFFSDELTTKNLLYTLSILKAKLPSTLRSKCFNKDNLPFEKEVINTELGHLFEHILLEYIGEIKRSLGMKNPIHNGITKWNWNKDKRGVFHITIDLGTKDEDILQVSLSKTMLLVEEIMISEQNIHINPAPSPVPLPLHLK